MFLIKESVLSLKTKQKHNIVFFTFKLPASTEILL